MKEGSLNNGLKVAIYARVSKDDASQDTENQLIELRRFAEASGWTVTKEYIDHESGKSGDREEFKALFADAAKRRYKAVLVWALDRFSREGIFATFDYIRTLKGHGVDFVSFQEPYFRTIGPAGDLLIAIMAWVAQQERKRIQERVLAGMRRARAHGTKSGKTIGRQWTITDREKVREARAAGLSYTQIQAQFGLSRGVIQRIIAGPKSQACSSPPS